MSKLKVESNSNQRDRWMGSYAILMTLLFALFVVMYATNQVKLEKLQKEEKKVEAKTSNISTESSPPQIEGHPADAETGETRQVEEKIRQILNMDLARQDLQDFLNFSQNDRGIVIRMWAKNFFSPGQVEVSQDLRPLLDAVAKVLGTSDRKIQIEGHATKDEPVGKSNHWELSSARAAWVARYWSEHFQIDPKRMGIGGFSFYQPIEIDHPLWEPGANRRVEIILLNP